MGAKKRRPVYILLTLSEQIALVNALENFSFNPGRSTTINSVTLGLGSLAEFMALLQIGSVHCKPLLGPQSRASGREAVMRSLAPVAECLRRVDSAVDQLNAHVSKYQQAFNQIYSQLETMTNTMGRIVTVLERMEQERSEEMRQRIRAAHERQQGVIRCECGRTVSVEKGNEDEEEENTDEDG